MGLGAIVKAAGAKKHLPKKKQRVLLLERVKEKVVD